MQMMYVIGGTLIVTGVLYLITVLLEHLDGARRCMCTKLPKGSVMVTMGAKPHGAIANFAKTANALRYRPTLYLPGAIAQTVTADFVRSNSEGITYTKETVALDDVHFKEGAPYLCCPDFIPKGRVVIAWHKPENKGPIVFICPGLTGDFNSAYVMRVCKALANSPQQYRPVVFHPRGRGGIPIDTPFLYSCGYTHDFRRVVTHVREKVGPDEKMYAVGFSMGGNYLVKYMGEEGAACELAGGCSLAGPVDCPKLMHNLTNGFLGKLLFDPFLTRSLHNVRREVENVFLDPGHPGVDVPTMRKASNLYEFDDSVTAPIMGCNGADEYYEQASSAHVLEDISRPVMFLHAQNDPIIPAFFLPFQRFEKNPHLVSLVTEYGAHSMDWPAGKRMTPWAPEVILSFLSHLE